MESELFRQFAIMNNESRQVNDCLYLISEDLKKNLNVSVKELTAQISSCNARLAALGERITEVDGQATASLASVRSDIAALGERITEVDGQATASLASVRSDIAAVLTTNDQQNARINSNFQTITNIKDIVSSLKYLYCINRTVLQQTTDANGFTRISMTSFPADIVAVSNDYVIALNVYDYRVSNYDTLVVSMCDYSNDSYINVRVSYFNGNTFTGNCRIQAWYLASNPSKDLPL